MRELEGNIGIVNFEHEGVQAELKTLKEISEGLEGSAKNGPYWLDTNNTNEFLTAYTRVGLLKERIIARSIPDLQTRLEGLEQEIASATRTIEFSSSEEGEVISNPRLRFVENNQIEFDGEKIQLGDRQFRILRYLNANIGEQVRSSIITQEILGVQSARVAGLNEIIQALKKKFNIPGREPLIISGGRAQASWVMLQGVKFADLEKEEESTEEVKPPVEVRDKRPSLEIDLEKREVKILVNEKEETVRISDDIEWEVFKFFKRNPGKEIVPYNSELMELPKSILGVRVANTQIQRINFAIQYLMGILNIEGLKPVITEKKVGEVLTYLFEAKEVTETGEELGQFDVRLSNGLVIKTEGSWESTALRRLDSLKGKGIQRNELTSLLFGRVDSHTTSMTYGVIHKLNLLLPASQQIVNERGMISLPVIMFPEVPDAEITPLTGSSMSVDTALWVDIPYEATKEEERSEEETRILDKVISVILQEPHSKIRFEVLQKELYSPKRSRSRSGIIFCQIYLAADLKLFFGSAFSKIREEALVEFLRSKWTEQEEDIYNNGCVA